MRKSVPPTTSRCTVSRMQFVLRMARLCRTLNRHENGARPVILVTGIERNRKSGRDRPMPASMSQSAMPDSTLAGKPLGRIASMACWDEGGWALRIGRRI